MIIPRLVLSQIQKLLNDCAKQCKYRTDLGENVVLNCVNIAARIVNIYDI